MSQNGIGADKIPAIVEQLKGRSPAMVRTISSIFQKLLMLGIMKKKETIKKGRIKVPIIKFEVGKVSKEQKEKLIAGFTKVASETLGIAEAHFIVLVKENDFDNWGVGGKMLSNILPKN